MGSLMVLLLAAGQGAPADAGVTKATMRLMFDAVVGLEPYVAHPELVRDPSKSAELTSRLDTLANLKHAFPASAKAQEPATAALSGLFSRYAQDTRQRFAQGETGAVPARIRTLVSLCFTCHSRERVATDVRDLDKRVEALGLGPFERAQFFAATRQFDKALETYRALLVAKAPDERAVLELSRASREALALSIRVKDDPDTTAALLAMLAKRDDIPVFLRGSVEVWQRDVAAWKLEKFDAATKTPDQLFARAQELVNATGGSALLIPDETHDIAYLRASAYVNMALAKNPAFTKRGEALYLLGICAGALRSPLLWDVDVLFYEACVRENPHTKVAAQCFHQVSQQLYFGYTGSSGTNLPPEELKRLAELRALAQ